MAEKRYSYIQFFAVLFCALVFSHGAKSQEKPSERNYLSSQLQSSGFQLTAPLLNQWRADQKKNLLEKIDRLPDSLKSAMLALADQALDFNWPSMPASLYLEYKQNGNRIHYETKLNERRDKLNILAIGELISHNGKYLRQIVNGLWATLEESTWEIPAIIVSQKAGADLPDPDEEVVGLVSAETAAMIATIRFMLADQLDHYSVLINKRIQYELSKRILTPYLQRDDFWWMGFKGNSVNNWNAWINTNVLQIAVLSENNIDILNRLVKKVCNSADYFINQYPADGGCDEGPSYWNIAGGKLIRLLQMAESISNGQLNWRKNRLIHNIGSYIYKMHIAGDYFVNFADATPRTIPNPESVYAFGKMFRDDSLKLFASYLFSLNKYAVSEKNIGDFLNIAEVFDELKALPSKAVLPAFSYLDKLQVLTARSQAGSSSGLFLAVQGGNNGESHNHNDVGNFIIYRDGRPVIIDAGVGTYTKQTFSNQRYELWNMQSAWHNCPIINGVMQKDGKEYKATEISFNNDKEHLKISMDIAAAYPSEAFVKKWERSFDFNTANASISLTDNYLLQKVSGNTGINFLSSCDIQNSRPGEMVFRNKKGNIELLLHYNPEWEAPLIEVKELEDPKLIGSWGSKIYRLSFISTNKGISGTNRFSFVLPRPD
jgi:hypothetical protein